jgi:hypothetical protein
MQIDPAVKSREVAARARLGRRGYRLEKCPRRDPLALGYGRFRILDLDGVIVSGATPRLPFTLTLEDVEKFIGDMRAPAITAEVAA